MTVIRDTKIDGAVLTGVPILHAMAMARGSGASGAFTSAVFNKVGLSVLEADSLGWFSTVNSRWTPQIAGWYFVNAGATIGNTGGSGGYINALALFKNGVEQDRLMILNPSAGTINNIQGSRLIYLNGTTDYLELYVYHGGPSPVVYQNGNATYLSAFLVRADP